MTKPFPVVQDEPELAELNQLTQYAVWTHGLFEGYEPLEKETGDKLVKLKVRYLVLDSASRVLWMNIVSGGKYNEDLQFIANNPSLHKLATIFCDPMPASPYGYLPHTAYHMGVEHLGAGLSNPLFGQIINATFVVPRPTAHEILGAQAALLEYLTPKVGEEVATELVSP